MQIDENTSNNKGDGGGNLSDTTLTFESTDDEHCNEFRSRGRFAKRNYRKRSNSNSSSSSLTLNYNAAVSPPNTTDTKQNTENTATVAADAIATDDTRSSDDEHSNAGVIGMYGLTSDSNSNSSNSSSSSSDSTSDGGTMSEECSSDSVVSEETENKLNRTLNLPMPK